jgi:REP element-mobilizing transposase RayT
MEITFQMNSETPQQNHFYLFHIVATIHDSRTSNRMIEYRARQRRFNGTKPFAEVIYLTKREELLIAQCVSELCNELNLRIAAFNLCLDHMHILLVCDEDEVSKIMHRIKGRTAKLCNEHRTRARSSGINPTGGVLKDGSTPFWSRKFYCKPILSEEQYWNTVNYIENNKVKHQLPKNPEMELIVQRFTKGFEICFLS